MQMYTKLFSLRIFVPSLWFFVKFIFIACHTSYTKKAQSYTKPKITVTIHCESLYIINGFCENILIEIYDIYSLTDIYNTLLNHFQSHLP